MRGNAESPREAVVVGAARAGLEELFRHEHESMYRLAADGAVWTVADDGTVSRIGIDP